MSIPDGSFTDDISPYDLIVETGANYNMESVSFVLIAE